MPKPFQSQLKNDLQEFLAKQETRFPHNDLLKIDLHCHDHNSDIPDELLGRLLNVPETWLPTERLIEELNKNGCTAYTITNHNNARSCYELQKKGMDVLTGAEFSCYVPDYRIGIHVLAYGFSPEEENRLNNLRKNIYHFQEYAHKNNIPTIWAHPLYHYAVTEMPPMDFFNKMGLIFERFEVINGQRDTWQNLLVREWVEGITPENIDNFSQKFNIDPSLYCSDIYRKTFSAGSDSHSGIFSGLTGTYLYIPNLKERLKTESTATLALEAIKKGDMIPYGSHQNAEKLTIGLLDYVAQVAINYKDPGLLRLLLHKGTTKEKMIGLFLSNIFLETQQHKVTSSFFKIFHQCIMGTTPSFLKKLILPASYNSIFEEAIKISKAYKNDPERIVEKYSKSIYAINDKLNEILFSRLTKKKKKFEKNGELSTEKIEELMLKLDLPTYVRSYISSEGDKTASTINISKLLDGLSFPFFASALILSAHFTSSKVMFNTRPFLNDFSSKLKKYQHPKRVLWMTDTFEDKNGVSVALQNIHKEVKERNLPIDFLVCSDTLPADSNLIIMKPVCEFTTPLYQNQPTRIPNLLDLHLLFHENEYDRIICSTEGIMGLMALYLKHAYSVKANFYIHTDWLMFAQKTLNLNSENQSRIQRVLRSFYGGFDKLFVLNSDHKSWLTDSKMNFSSEKIAMTAHWVEPIFTPKQQKKKSLFGVNSLVPILLYVGRLSNEKGIMELPRIYKRIQKRIPTVQLVVVGQGPASQYLEQKIPDVIYFDWLCRKKLPEIYSSADLLLFPSKFDTFGCAVLEALSCGLPVIAYNTKGPKEIIENNISGILVNNEKEMSEKATAFLENPDSHLQFRKSARKRAQQYNADTIMDQLLKDLGL